MKYLESYKNPLDPNRVKDYFYDKINWKLIKFVDSCTVEHEDNGIIFNIKVSLVDDANSFGIYDFRTKEWAKYSRWRRMGEFIKAYKKIGKLNYDIFIISNTNSKDDKKALEKIKNQISNKFNCEVKFGNTWRLEIFI